ncbi:MAG: glycosyltransferase family 1 protein [Pseudomonadota bacterium]
MDRPLLYLDVSRLVRRYEFFGGPTGIDRVDLAYGRWLTTQTAFEPVAVTRGRRTLLALAPAAFGHLIATLDARWGTDAPPGFGREGRTLPQYVAQRCAARLQRWTLLAGARAPLSRGRPSVYLNVGHDGLDNPALHKNLAAAKVALIHDVIPLTHPEYDTARATALHERRLNAIAAQFDHIITTSAAARDAMLNHLGGSARFTTTVAHLAPALPQTAAPAPSDRPTFVHLSTINRRKNLALLLHLWREFADHPRPPRLAIIGRRGNDQTALELMDRCAALRGNIIEHGTLSDAEAASALAGARGLLTPSFAEGFGLPIVEAYRFGVPVIASDIPAHREVGGEAAIYVNPLDAVSWREQILRLGADDGLWAKRRAAIKPPATWDGHFRKVEPVLLSLAR